MMRDFSSKGYCKKITLSINKSKKLKIFSITTNGFFTKKIIKIVGNILKNNKKIIFIINISIDGDEKHHNDLRGNKLSFLNAEETLENLQLLKNKYPNLVVNEEFLLNRKNISQFEKVKKKKNNIITIHQNSKYYGNEKEEKQDIILKKKDIQKTKGYFKKKFLNGYINKKYNCYALRSSIFIDWNGDIKPCIMWDKKIGNIEKHNIKHQLQNSKNLKYIKRIKEKKCPGCWTPCEGYLSIIHEFRK